MKINPVLYPNIAKVMADRERMPWEPLRICRMIIRRLGLSHYPGRLSTMPLRIALGATFDDALAAERKDALAHRRRWELGL